ncbi:MAG: hypothetical protein BGO59_35090 [Spirosoma sp. 48-14]|nr:MAG: hypothetical protein BGO59_35090 [Spirosoma sp. 48-14]
MLLLTTTGFTQSTTWVTEKSKDGTVTVQSCVSKRTDAQGHSHTWMEYVATITANVRVSACVAVLKDIARHKNFLDAKASRQLSVLTTDSWLVYYYFHLPWPMPDSDCVAKMQMVEDELTKTVTFTLSAAPTLFEKKAIDRITQYNLTYQFKDLGIGLTALTITSSVVPTAQVPIWIMRNYFPEGPADVLHKLLQMANQQIIHN